MSHSNSSGGPVGNGRRSHRSSTASMPAVPWGGPGGGAMSAASSYAALPAAPVYAQYQHPPQQQSQGIYPAMLTPMPQAPGQSSAFIGGGGNMTAGPGGGAPPPLPLPPPFQFLRLKSFSPHTHALLRRLESAIHASPHSPQAWLDLGEEYRVLGARSAFLRLLEHAKRLFPSESAIRLLLYAHAPHRPRTPPAAEAPIQMSRTHTYDYKWRHRETTNVFPARLHKLDTAAAPPIGRGLRAQHLAFLELLEREGVWESKEEKRTRRARVLEQMLVERGREEGGDDDGSHAAATAGADEPDRIRGGGGAAEVGKRGVAIVIPARFNGSTDAHSQAQSPSHPLPLPFAVEPVVPGLDEDELEGAADPAPRSRDLMAGHQQSQPQPRPHPHLQQQQAPSASISPPAAASPAPASSPSSSLSPSPSHARKMLSPSKSQARRESGGSVAAMLAAAGAGGGGGAAATAAGAGGSNSSPAASRPPAHEALSEEEVREQRERQWAAEEAALQAEEAAEAQARQRELDQLAASREAHAKRMQQLESGAQPQPTV